jgi:hypothetical protein
VRRGHRPDARRGAGHRQARALSAARLAEAASSLLELGGPKRQGIITSRGRELIPAQRSSRGAREFRDLIDDATGMKVNPRVITLADAAPDDAAAIASLLAELHVFYGDTPQRTQGERAAQVRAVLFADPPGARAPLGCSRQGRPRVPRPA